MILRRFMTHLKEQNWIAVGLDVLVVITGIFLGFQVNTWNETRKNTNDAIYYLTELNTLVQEEISQISSEDIPASTEALTHRQRAIELLYLDNWNKSERKEFSLKHRSIYVAHSEKIKPPALFALYDNGKMEHINSREVQSAIQHINEAYYNFNGYISLLRGVQLNAQNDAVAVIEYGLSDNLMEITTESEILLSEKSLKSAFRILTLTESNQIKIYQGFLKQLTKHQSVIQIYIKKLTQ